MNDKELNALFEAVEQTPVDEATRSKAVNEALAAFDDQGFSDSDRPTANITSLFRRKSMKQITQSWVVNGMASAAVVVLAVVLVFNIDTGLIPDGQQLPVPLDEKQLVGNASEAMGDLPASGSSSVLASSSEAPSAADADGTAIGKRQGSIEQKPAMIEEVVVTAQMQPEAFGQIASSAKLLNAAPTVQRSLRKADYSDIIAMPLPDGNDSFEQFDTNALHLVSENPVSTFSIDVDTASYSFVRRQLNSGVLPQKAAVRLEEMVNYFPYDYALPASRDIPFATHVNLMASPWKAGNQLVHIGIKGYEQIEKPARSNIVFLLDVSGSMSQPDKLPLVKQSMSLLLSQLQPEDTVAIAVYAGAAGTILEPTPVREKQKILNAMNRLQAGGSTAGAAGIKLAYQLAEANFTEQGVNRVFIATDGDFNVGITNHDELTGFIERKRDKGVYLSILGFGQGNYNDALMQQLAQNGNGIAAYIDTLGEAQKVLVDEAQSTLFPIANDVKIQIEFNPATIKEYRLLGYETRMLATEDFNNDQVDAGEIGAGHTVTAIYEITPVGSAGLLDESRYGTSRPADESVASELGFLKLRYKLPGDSQSKLISQPIPTVLSGGDQESRFAIAVAGFAQLLKDGKYIDGWGFDEALAMAIANKGEDAYGYRAELTQLIRKAMVAAEM